MLWENFLYNLLTKSEKKSLCPQTSTEKLVVCSYKQSRCLIKTFFFFTPKEWKPCQDFVRSVVFAQIIEMKNPFAANVWLETQRYRKLLFRLTFCWAIQSLRPHICDPFEIPPGISLWGNSNRKFYHKHYPSVLNSDPILWKCLVTKIIEYPLKFIFLSRSQVKMNAQP